MCFVGDSLTQRGLWSEFFPDLHVANRGIGTDTSEGILNRLDSVISSHPTVVFVMIGVNDIAHAIETEITLSNVRAITERLSAALPDATIVLQSVLPSEGIDEAIVRHLNDGYGKIASEFNKVYFIDMHKKFLDEAGNRNVALYSPDGVHLNGDGYRIWIASIEKRLPASRIVS